MKSALTINLSNIEHNLDIRAWQLTLYLDREEALALLSVLISIAKPSKEEIEMLMENGDGDV